MPNLNLPNQTPFDVACTNHLINVISHKLNHWILETKDLPKSFTPFYSPSFSSVPLAHYLKQSAIYLELDETYYIYMVIYIERYFKNIKSDHIDLLNIHLLAFTCLTVAHKLLDDFPIATAYYIHSGLEKKYRNELESYLLKTINYELFISEKEYLSCKADLVIYAQVIEDNTQDYSICLSSEEEKKLGELEEMEPFNYESEQEYQAEYPAESPRLSSRLLFENTVLGLAEQSTQTVHPQTNSQYASTIGFFSQVVVNGGLLTDDNKIMESNPLKKPS